MSFMSQIFASCPVLQTIAISMSLKQIRRATIYEESICLDFSFGASLELPRSAIFADQELISMLVWLRLTCDSTGHLCDWPKGRTD